MTVSREYQEFILDLLRPLAPMPRRMFSGVGLFHSGAMFALLVRDAMYLRVDEATRARFEQAGSGPFTYSRAGREVSLSAYYLLPEELLDEPDEMLKWAREAIGAALRATASAGSAKSRSSGRGSRRKQRAGSG
jgi:DNA transformation protein and related proteins